MLARPLTTTFTEQMPSMQIHHITKLATQIEPIHYIDTLYSLSRISTYKTIHKLNMRNNLFTIINGNEDVIVGILPKVPISHRKYLFDL